MKRIIAFSLALLMTPAPLLAMDPATYARDLTTAERTDLTRAQREAAYAGLLRQRDLTPVQKAEVYRLRAIYRMSTGANLKDAAKDYEEALALNRADPRIPPALAYARTMIAEAEARVTKNEDIGSARAEDLYLLGRYREAHAIWKQMTSIGLYPNESAIKRMIEDRVMCPMKPRAKIAVPAESSYGHGDLIICTL